MENDRLSELCFFLKTLKTVIFFNRKGRKETPFNSPKGGKPQRAQ